jgi:uncharacterized membrane protein
MTVLILGLIIFLSVHSLRIFAEPARNRWLEARGEGGFKGIYSVISLIGLVLIVWGYGMARADGPPVLYDPPLWTRHISYLLMLPVFVFLLASVFPGRISDALKHPLLVAVKAWALAHLITNGDLASVLLFGSFLVWAVVDRISVKRRAGPAFRPPVSRKPANDIIAGVGGLLVYAVFLVWAHAALIGVPLLVL